MAYTTRSQSIIEGNQDRNLETGTMEEMVVDSLSCTAQDHLLIDNATYSGIDPDTSTNNQNNLSQA